MGISGAAMNIRILMHWVLLGLVSYPFFGGAEAADRVLVMAISDYEQAPLPGAKVDRQNVREMLPLLGVQSEHVRVLSDNQLGAKSIKQAFSDLADQTRAGDRVFIFFSGHGTSRLVDGVCQQALIARDMWAVNPADINQALNAIKDKASKVVMMVDACHSGGVVGTVGAGLSRGSSNLRPKFVAPDKAEEQCKKPINLVAEGMQAMRSTRGSSLANNYLYISAAQANEVAFDDPVRGGLATSALLTCLKSGIPDTDRSGSVSYSELVQCAQGNVENYLKGAATMRPHHLQMAGNPDMPIITRAVQEGSKPADPVATLRDLARGADSRWEVQLKAQPPKAKIGKDAFRLTVTSSETGYLTLLYVGSDGREFMQLYPEKPGTPVKVSANSPFQLPEAYAAHGPVGVNHLLAVVSATPRDFSPILGNAGAAKASLAAAAALQQRAQNLKSRPGNSASPEAYGATLIALEEQ